MGCKRLRDCKRKDCFTIEGGGCTVIEYKYLTEPFSERCPFFKPATEVNKLAIEEAISLYSFNREKE